MPELYRIIKNYFEQLYANELDNLEEMTNLPRLNHEDIENMNNNCNNI